MSETWRKEKEKYDEKTELRHNAQQRNDAHDERSTRYEQHFMKMERHLQQHDADIHDVREATALLAQ
eukprot:13841596-Alexandrium_andersonii.AAC.1